MITELKNNHYYMVRFKGFKLDKSWENFRICRACCHISNPSFEFFKFIELSTDKQFWYSSESIDAIYYEVSREISKDIVEKFLEIKKVELEKRTLAIEKFVTSYDAKMQAKVLNHLESLAATN